LLFNAKCKEAYPFARLSAGSGHLRPSAYGAQKQASGGRKIKSQSFFTAEFADVHLVGSPRQASLWPSRHAVGI